MQVVVQLVGLLDGGRPEDLEPPPRRVALGEGATIHDLLANIDVDEAAVQAIELNGRPEGWDTGLRDGDSILLKGMPYGGM